MEVPLLVEFKALVLRNAWRRNEFIHDVDGFWIWSPAPAGGAFNSAHLEMLNKLLKEANRKWQLEMNLYFRKEKNAGQ